MPERVFSGHCPDCGEGFSNLIFNWEMRPWIRAVWGSAVVEWSVTHHQDKLSGVCNMTRLLVDGKDVGFLQVTKLKSDSKATNSKEWSISFNIYSKEDVVSSG